MKSTGPLGAEQDRYVERVFGNHILVETWSLLGALQRVSGNHVLIETWSLLDALP